MTGWFSRALKIQIRTCRSYESAALSKLHTQGFERGWGVSEFETLLCESTVRVHLAEMQLSEPCGFIISRIAVDEAEILSVVVAKNARRKGVGGQLLNTHLSALAQSGAQTVFLEVDELNVSALALYKHFGFEKVGERKSYYKHKDGTSPAALVMRRYLK